MKDMNYKQLKKAFENEKYETRREIFDILCDTDEGLTAREIAQKIGNGMSSGSVAGMITGGSRYNSYSRDPNLLPMAILWDNRDKESGCKRLMYGSKWTSKTYVNVDNPEEKIVISTRATTYRLVENKRG